MAWLLVTTALVVIWVASLCKILHVSVSSSGSTFLNNDGTPQKRNVLLVVAHPDDESMFFSPTISYLTSRGHKLHILCMSIGNADGKGAIRREELYKACEILKVPLNQVKILDHPDLQDGFGKIWDHKLLAKIIEQEISSHGIDSIITFDSYGVSGHCNHRDVHCGVQSFLYNKSPKNLDAWELVLGVPVKSNCYFEPKTSTSELLFQDSVLIFPCSQNSFLAMAQHSSQWVWFRKLFVAFSSYTYVNKLRRIS